MPLKAQRESSSVDTILLHLRKIPGSRWLKKHGGMYSQKGEPDIYGCVRGQMVHIEVKKEGGKVDPLQPVILEEWRKAGAITGLCRSWEEVESLLRSHGLV